MDTLSTAAVAVSGFTACSEFASFAFVHPVVRRLPAEHHLTVEQGLLRTFGRVMPVLMPATGARRRPTVPATGGLGGGRSQRGGARLHLGRQRADQQGHRHLGPG